MMFAVVKLEPVEVESPWFKAQRAAGEVQAERNRAMEAAGSAAAAASMALLLSAWASPAALRAWNHGLSTSTGSNFTSANVVWCGPPWRCA